MPAHTIEPMTAPTRTIEGLARACGDLLRYASGAPETAVEALAYDSRRVGPGALFFCVPGATHDGHDFAATAVAAGAVALVDERRLDLGVPEIVVGDARRAMGRVAAAFYGHPAAELELIGVTGTNGKTTTAYLVRSILEAAGRTTGLIGTIETRVGTAVEPGVRTTPEALDLHRLFARMRDAGVNAVAMEVTSHALVQHRVEGVAFEVAAFTNLTQDHLDFHAGMEDYFAAKRSLFEPGRARAGVYNVDDPYGRRLREASPVPAVGFGLAADAEVRAANVKRGPQGSVISVRHGGGELTLSTPLIGDFNVYNCLAACAAALRAGISEDAICGGVSALRSVPGRFETVERGQPFTVVVDYAHTPDSLDNVLRAGRRIADRQQGRLLCVFGCGGDRDRGKRPLMGAVAGRLADVVVVTSDNPRSEDPEAIIGEILGGLIAERPAGADTVLPDRRAAIGAALGRAAAGDVVVIAGKGHEIGQEIRGRTLPFDDRIVAAEALEALGWIARGASAGGAGRAT